MLDFIPEQRWYSIMEPELGLGSVTLSEGRTVEIYFPLADIMRVYEKDGAPLMRVYLAPGHTFYARDGKTFKIESVEEKDNHYYYCGEGYTVHEQEMDDTIDISTPENRLKGGNLGDYRDFDLRVQAHNLQYNLLQSPVRGFGGVRMQLFEHQIYIADQAAQRHRARLLLADEVGLGKTIEAALIIHKMLLSGRIERVLIIVPPALIYQWFVELLKRFNLTFRVLDTETLEEYHHQHENILSTDQLFICPCNILEKNHTLFTEDAWDMIVVDEAHHINYNTPLFSTIKALSEHSEHVLLLSATPEQSGQKDHFRRLQLLDPPRFHDFDSYLHEQKKYASIAETAEKLHKGLELNAHDKKCMRNLYSANPHAIEKLLDTYCAAHTEVCEELLQRLLDLHGIGRLLFRNVRSTVSGFPRRNCIPIALQRNGKGSQKKDWLYTLIQRHPSDKIVVLCGSKKEVEDIISHLSPPHSHKTPLKIARFHEDMSLMERDRQAAWFFEETGPKLLIASPLGAEGRNFQCAHKLVLFDIPPEPEQLEQRIGRLDRIGQGDHIDIYVPYTQQTPEERLYQWYDALNAFETPWHGSQRIMETFGERLKNLIYEDETTTWEAFLNNVRTFQQELRKDLEKGRDILLELNSYNPRKAQILTQQIIDQEDNDDVEEFMIYALDRGGIDAEEIGFRTYNLTPNLFYTKPFPGFNENGMVISFNRELCLQKDDATLLSWDHPMVRDTLDGIITGDTGNASSAKLASNTQGIILEILFTIESTLPKKLRGERFLPPTPVHLFIDQQGNDCSQKYHGITAADLEEFNATPILQKPKVQEIIETMIQAGRDIATKRISDCIAGAQNRVKKELTPQIARLKELALVNPSVSNDEIKNLTQEYNDLISGFSSARLRLDALRFIALYPKR